MTDAAGSIPVSAPPAPTVGEAFSYWLKLGFISFGGPAGQISIMHQELVERRRWISEHRFLHALNYCMLLPGPEAIQLAIYISWLLHGLRGAVIAGVLFFLPAFVLLSLLAWVYLSFGDVPAVQGIFYGIKPAVVAVVLFAAWRIGSRAIRNRLLLAVALLAFVGIFVFKIEFPWIVLAAAVLGAIGGKLAPDKFRGGGGHGTSDKLYGPALIDDETPPPPHATIIACCGGSAQSATAIATAAQVGAGRPPVVCACINRATISAPHSATSSHPHTGATVPPAPHAARAARAASCIATRHGSPRTRRMIVVHTPIAITQPIAVTTA